MTETNLAAMELAESTKRNSTTSQEVIEFDWLIEQINHVCDVVDTSVDPVIQHMQMLSIKSEEW